MKLNPALQQLLKIPEVSDVLIMGCDSSFVFDGAWKQVANPFRTAERLRQQIIELVMNSGERWDIAKPFVDFSVGNLRFHALMGGVVANEDQLAIRIHRERPIEDLDPKLGLIAESDDSYLISGVTGSGKTTLLSQMLSHNDQRTVLVEQTPEIELSPPSVTIRSRRANIEGAGSLSSTELLNQALRMRPDRIAIGEVRGAEVISLLLAINNGHKGAAATIHAQSPEAVKSRLITLGLIAGVGRELVMDLSQSIDWLIHVENCQLEGIYTWRDI